MVVGGRELAKHQRFPFGKSIIPNWATSYK
nr:MAG TPA: hypothetical protein [Caudoviricetes sp.]DAX28982.1 MAG TPA: hypothetical protein [Caudoviricetes sp.]